MREMIDYRDYLIGILADPEEAIAYLQASVEEYQKDGDTVALLIALESIAKAQSENKGLTAQIYLLSGVAHHSRKEYDWAIEDYNTVLALKPDNTEAYQYRALAYDKTGEFDHTHEAFTKIAQLDPEQLNQTD